MKKSDLKSGMIVELRDGKRYLFTSGVLLDFDGYIMLINYTEDLKSKHYEAQDIVKVYKGNKPHSLTSMFKDTYLTMQWERKEIKLTDEEIEILKALKTLDFEWLARDEDDALNAYSGTPYKDDCVWNFVSGRVYQSIGVYSNLFDFVKWEDEEPTYIDDLLKEKENEINL